MTREADTYERHAAPLTNLFTGHVLDAAGDLAGTVLIDVACGTGLVARAAARRGARRVLGVDLLDWMAARARQRAVVERLDNVSFARMDAAHLALRDAVADAALCQFGLMLMDEAEAAARELRRITRPGGKIVCAVWSTPDRAPAFADFLDAAGEVVSGEPLSPTHAIFRLGGDGVLAGLLADAGLIDVEERRIMEVDTRASPEAYWAWMSSTVGFRGGPDEEAPVTTADRLGQRIQQAIRGRTLARADCWRRPDGSLRFPMEAVVVRAVVPGQ
ncbi:MAG: methyltransferase domain-containing protein [Chloroflexota bacterium]|nr:methyltransferase domain-containing protein [Chloroflexota bacterium]